MKSLLVCIFSSLAILLMSDISVAGELTTPHTFVSGTKAKAAEVNENFSAVELEVNDNHNRVTAVENQISNIETGCPAGESIRQITSDGTIICQVDTNTDTDTLYFAGTGLSLSGTTFRVSPGVISVAAHAFDSESTSVDQVTQCILRKASGVGYAYFLAIPAATAASCDAVAGIQFPDDITLDGLYCTVYDNDASNSLTGNIIRVNMVTGTTETVYTTAASIDINDEQVILDSSPNEAGRNIVNNATFAYYVAINYSTNDFSTLGVLGRFYGCRLAYQP